VPTDRDTEDGLLRLRAVVRANPRSTAFVALAHALSDLGRDDEAEEISRTGLAQHPNLVTGQVALGRALIGRGRLREAQEQLVEAARANPEHGDAFRWLGELVLRRGQAASARTLLEYAEELLPSDARVAELLLAAGGAPQPKTVRPRTDFEDTRVGDIRRLAERMHEDPPPVPTGNGASSGKATGPGKRDAVHEESITSEFEPQPPRSKPGAQADAALAASAGKVAGKGEGKNPALARPGTKSAAKADADPSRARGNLAARVGRGTAARVRRIWASGAAVRWAAVTAVAVVLAGVAWLAAPAKKTHVGAALPETAPPSPPMVAAVDMTAAIAAGSLEGLATVRALGKQLLEKPGSDPDQLAAAGFAAALLVGDYGVPGTADALELASAAAKAAPPHPARTALIEASRALVAIAAGHLGEAQAAAGRALAAQPDGAEALLAAGRVMLRQGKVTEAREALAKAASRVPVIASVALDRAAAAIDAADADAAATELGGLLARQDDLRAHLILAEAERLAGKPTSAAGAKALKDRCREEAQKSPMLRTACAAETAQAARLAADRSAAVRAARAATAGGGRNPRALAQGALVLANLGEIEAAADAIRKIRDDSGPAFVPRVFAQLAVNLGRGDVPETGSPVPKATGAEARLVLARLAFAQGGVPALTEHLAQVPPPLIEADPDLSSLAVLAGAEGQQPLDARRQTILEERAEKGGGIAAYVLGRLAAKAGDGKTAALRLHRAVQTSPDACEAARLLLTIDKKLRPTAVATDAKVGALLRAHNGGCVHGPR
jgi:tetratricopeptide (TPR) repeat protein